MKISGKMSAGWLAARARSRCAVIAGLAAAAVAACGLVAAGPARAASYPTVNLYFISNFNGVVGEIPAGGGSTIDLASGTFGNGIAVDDKGNVFYGTLTALYEVPVGTTTSEILKAPGFAGDFALALDAKDDVYASEGGTITEYPADGSAPVVVADAAEVANIGAFTIDAAGDIFLANYQDGNSSIYEIPAGLKTAILLTDLGAGESYATMQMALSPNQKTLYFSWKTATHDLLASIPTAGGAVTEVTPNTGNFVQGVAVDSAGNIYATSIGGSPIHIYEIPAGTSTIEAAGYANYAPNIAVEPAAPPTPPKPGCAGLKASVTAAKVVTVNPRTYKGPVTAHLSCDRISRADVWVFTNVGGRATLVGSGAATGTAKTTLSLGVTIQLNRQGRVLAHARNGIKVTIIASITRRGSSSVFYTATTARVIAHKPST